MAPHLGGPLRGQSQKPRKHGAMSGDLDGEVFWTEIKHELVSNDLFEVMNAVRPRKRTHTAGTRPSSSSSFVVSWSLATWFVLSSL